MYDIKPPKKYDEIKINSDNINEMFLKAEKKLRQMKLPNTKKGYYIYYIENRFWDIKPPSKQ